MSVNVCPNCNTPIIPGSAFCDNCGLNIPNAQPAPAGVSGSVATQYQTSAAASANSVQCPNCGTFNAPGSAFCENCGMQVSSVASDPQPASVPAIPGGCPQCGYNNVPGASFCEQCGTPLSSVAPVPQSAPAPAPEPAPVPIPDDFPPTPTPVLPVEPAAVVYVEGRLIIEGSGVSLPLLQGRQEASIGREDPVSNIFPDINLDPYGGHDNGVGRQHAKLVIIGGQLCLVDLNSVNGSFVNRQKVLPGQPQPVHDGDEIRLGRIVLIYHT